MGDSRLDHDSFGPGCGWEVAFVAYPYDFAVEAQGEEYLGGGGEQGHDTHHEMTLAQARGGEGRGELMLEEGRTEKHIPRSVR